jgi:hypothetical protein
MAIAPEDEIIYGINISHFEIEECEYAGRKRELFENIERIIDNRIYEVLARNREDGICFRNMRGIKNRVMIHDIRNFEDVMLLYTRTNERISLLALLDAALTYELLWAHALIRAQNMGINLED